MSSQLLETLELLDKAMESKDLEQAAIAALRLWLHLAIVNARQSDPTLEELTYLKTAVEAGDSTYLVTFMHVKGDKINLRKDAE